MKIKKSSNGKDESMNQQIFRTNIKEMIFSLHLFWRLFLFYCSLLPFTSLHRSNLLMFTVTWQTDTRVKHVIGNLLRVQRYARPQLAVSQYWSAHQQDPYPGPLRQQQNDLWSCWISRLSLRHGSPGIYCPLTRSTNHQTEIRWSAE